MNVELSQSSIQIQKNKKFIERAKLAHGNKYDYSRSVYINQREKVEIICPIHGIFRQSPSNHIYHKQDCPDCGKVLAIENKKVTAEEFIYIFHQTYDRERYSLEKMNYIDYQTPIVVVCSEHNEIVRSPKSIIHRSPCPKCGINSRSEKRRMAKQIFIDRAQEIHKNQYDYSKVDYKNIVTKIKIICPIHGIFEQVPYSHLQGNGCAKCGFVKTKNAQMGSLEHFLTDAKRLHGDRFDYSLAEYKGNKVKLKILCKLHGEFKMSPKDHLRPSICPKCASFKRATDRILPLDKFIARSSLIHNNRYDYSLVSIKNVHQNVKIICPTHGVFKQSPSAHMKGANCRKCYLETKNDTLEEFLAKAVNVHGQRYDYSGTIYKNSKSPIEIICKIHGPFVTTPSCHLTGSNCFDCVQDTRRITLEEFLQRANIHFNYKYNYSKVKFDDTSDIIEIICPKHGSFFQRASSHISVQGHGCANCAKDDLKISRADFLERSREIHADKYDYSGVNFNNSKDIVNIVCPIHGAFRQRVGIHLNGSGCQDCSDLKRGVDGLTNFLMNSERANEPCFLYFVEVDFHGKAFLKIGIARDIEKRGHGKFRIIHSRALIRAEAWAIEQKILRDTIEMAPNINELDYDGRTELRDFSKTDRNLICKIMDQDSISIKKNGWQKYCIIENLSDVNFIVFGNKLSQI